MNIFFMDSQAGRIENAVQVACAKEMMMSKGYRIHPGEASGRMWMDSRSKTSPPPPRPVGCMFISQFRDRVEPGHLRIDMHAFHVVPGLNFHRLSEIYPLLPRRRGRMPDGILPYYTRRPGRRIVQLLRYPYSSTVFLRSMR